MTLLDEIREYVAFADALLLEAVRDGTVSIEEAKKNAAETERWREKLMLLEAREARV